jgi:hypothetical protein
MHFLLDSPAGARDAIRVQRIAGNGACRETELNDVGP